MPTIPTNDLVQAILELDAEQLAPVADAVKFRTQTLQTQVARSLRRGDRVTIGPRVSPKYLAGVEATVVKVNQKSVTVDLDEPTGRFHKNIGLPIELLGDKIS